MPHYDRPVNPSDCRRRRRRRRDFLEVLQQSQKAAAVPLVDVGQRLREIRSENGLTIRDLARKSGLNVNTLSMIENGNSSPSLETLQQLSITLGMPITAFFEDGAPRNQVIHYQASQRPQVAFSHGTLEDLGSGASRPGAETFLITLEPLSDSGDDDIVHTGHETVFCLDGQFTYTIESRDFVLEPGDSLFFEAHLPHRWQNASKKPARALLVLCPSDEHDSPTERHFAPKKTFLEEDHREG